MKVLGIELPKNYRRHLKYNTPVVIGIDTESLVTGYAFLVSDSNGKYAWIRSFDDVLTFFDNEDYSSCLLVAFNLNFDVSVLLKWMGEKLCRDIVTSCRITLPSCHIEYIPGKYLQFRFGNKFVRIFDVAQFFEGSLDYNAKKYLGCSKSSLSSKSFTNLDYGRQDVLTYCAKDAVLTQGLGEYVVEAFNKLGVSVQSLVSPAGIVESYAVDQLGIRNTVGWIPREALEMSIETFEGAWFENFKAGTFPKTYRYDLVSAYPSVIRNLLDLSLGNWVHDKVKPTDAIYGRVFATITVPQGHISPIIFSNSDDDSIHPYGTWTRKLCYQEVEWLRDCGGKAKILDAWWFVPFATVYKYRGVVDKFFEVKKKATADSMEFWSSKVGLAGLYGKFLQHKGGRGGRLYNPVYAAEITSSVRLQVAKLCLQSPQNIISVMSDCVVSDTPLDVQGSTDIGGWKVKGPDNSLWLGPAQYEADGQSSFRHINWKKLLEADPTLVDYVLKRLGPLTLVQGIMQNQFEQVGVFGERKLTFNIRKLNWRRFWPKRPNCGGDLLTNQYESRQICVSSRLKHDDMVLWSL